MSPFMALNGNSLSGAEIVSCWGYSCRRGRMRRLVADPFVPIRPAADEPAFRGCAQALAGKPANIDARAAN